jgi:hypothetical protein
MSCSLSVLLLRSIFPSSGKLVKRTVALFLLAGGAYPQSAITPPAGDLEVFYHYLESAHLEMVDVSRGAKTSEIVSDRLHAQVESFSALDRIYLLASSAIAGIDAESRSYLDDVVKNKQRPALAQLDVYYARRIQTLRDARDQLRVALGPSEWSRIEGFLDGEFRQRINRRALPWPNLK